MPLDPNSHVPIYQQICQHVRGAVAAGVYRTGEALPSIRALALEMVVNPNTVQRAYRELERQGLMMTRKGLGAFVSDNGGQAARRGSEVVVSGTFEQGVRIGRSAGIACERLTALFDAALGDEETSAKPDHQENGDSVPNKEGTS